MTEVFNIALLVLALVYLGFLSAVALGLRRSLVKSDRSESFETVDDLPLVSLVIPARDEASSIEDCLGHVVRNSYPADRLEVIVVDDHSTDETASIAARFVDRLPGLKVISRSNGETGKTAAINDGIATSQGSLIMTTDADCRLSPSCILSNVHHYLHGASVVAGSVLYERPSSTFGAIQSLEFLGLVCVGAGTIGLGRPTICNSSNLMYSRDLARRIAPEGFNHTAAADELIIQSLRGSAGEYAVYNADQEAFALASPVASMSEFFRQRLRWASSVGTFRNYGAVLIAVILFVFLLILAASPLIYFLIPSMRASLGVAWLIKCIADLFVLVPAARHYRRLNLLKWFPVAEILHAPYVSIAVVLGMVTTVDNYGRGGWK